MYYPPNIRYISQNEVRNLGPNVIAIPVEAEKISTAFDHDSG